MHKTELLLPIGKACGWDGCQTLRVGETSMAHEVTPTLEGTGILTLSLSHLLKDSPSGAR